jgi:transcriptional antiterminator Rof (Rho-off)
MIKVPVDQEVLKMNEVYRLVLTLKLSIGENINKSAEALLVAGKWVDLEVNSEKTKHVFMSVNRKQIKITSRR